MFFRAQNLGPLLDAEVDLSKDLIVLAGPNNAGKTYLAWSVYGLHRSPPPLNGFLDGWVRRLLESPDPSIDLRELLPQDGPALFEKIGKAYKSQLHLCFATESTHFASTEVSLRGLDLGRRREHELSYLPLDASALRQHGWMLGWTLYPDGKLKPFFTGVPEERFLSPIWVAATPSMLTTFAEKDREGLEGDLRSNLNRLILSELLPSCTIFPAERIAVNIFAKELALKRTELVDELVDADLDDQRDATMNLVRRRAGRYPWPIRDSLKTANDLANLGRNAGPFADLAAEIESAVLGGGVVVSDTGEMLFSPASAADSHLQMHLTASVVKSLSSLVFYFRFLARHGDFIIIDEPELNLHPDNQRKIARILAKAVGRGFKVMVSTHSDYVLRELNHLIMLSKVPADEARQLGYDPGCALAPERVGVYLFHEQRASAVPVGETGFAIKTIDDVVNQLNADEQRLYARLAD